jgi:hypothetical protein
MSESGEDGFQMSYKILRASKWRFVVAALFAFVQFSMGSNTPLVSGSYEVVRNTDLGSHAQIRMRIHLVNHGPNNLSVRKMSLWDFSHPDKGRSQACALVLHAHESAETTQEFTMRRPDYESWLRGQRPRLVLEMAAPGSAKSTAVVRLDRISGRGAK